MNVNMRILLPPGLALLGLVFLRAALPAEVGIGGGLAGFGGLGGQVHWQPRDWRWRLGFEYARVPDYKFEDPFTGRPLTLEKEDFTGPFVHYQFTPGREGRWYAGVSVLRWKRTERSLVFGDWRSDSTVDAYVGGGYLRRFGAHGFYNLAVFFAPWAKLSTGTSTSSNVSDGASDIHLNAGLVF